MPTTIVTCDICVEKINKKNYFVECIHCNYKSCVTCCKKYILDSLNEPKCMSCLKEWNREFLSNNFTDTFVSKDYKKHRENLIFEKQMSMLHATQADVEKKKKIDNLDEKIKNLKIQYSDIKQEIRELMQEKRNTIQETKKETKKEKYYGKCPSTTCNGFITSSWKCGICDLLVCKSCKEKINDDEAHICDPSILLSVQLIKTECSPCPKCKADIYKIGGCDQMWCVTCHTTFSFKTGEIENKQVHNPHYFEWMRKNGTNHVVPDQGVLGCININNINGRIFNNSVVDKAVSIMCADMIRFISHCTHVELPRFDVDILNYEYGVYKDLRIEYLIGSLEKEDMKKKLQYNEKKIYKKHNVYLILDMFLQTSKTYIIDTVKLTDNTIKRLLTELEITTLHTNLTNLIEYTNDSFVKLGSIVNNKHHVIIYDANGFHLK